MRSKLRNALLPILALLLAVSLVLAFAPMFARAEDTDTFVLLKDTTMSEGEAVGSNTAAIEDGENGAVTVTGKQKDSRTVLVYDHGYTMGSKLNFTVRNNPDITATGTSDALRPNVYFSMFFAQAEKKDGNFDAADFKHSRTKGNGVSVYMFTNEDLYAGNRVIFNISTFGKRDIVNVDSLYSGLSGSQNDGMIDLGQSFTRDIPLGIEMGTEKVGGVEHFYIVITSNRPERPDSTFKTSIPMDQLVKDEDSQANPYYVGFEYANVNGTERNVNSTVSAIAAEESGLSVTPESIFLKPGQTQPLQIKDLNSDEAVTEVTLTSDNPEVATVENGLVTAVKAGTCKITASAADGRSGEAYVTVANNITLNMNKTDLQVGEFTTLTATTNPSGLSVKWTSSDDEVVTVDGGTLQALKAGTATVTATIVNFESGELELKTTCEITVSAYEKPEDKTEGDYRYLYSDAVIARGNGFAQTDKGVAYNGSIQNGNVYAVIGEGISFDNPVTFDVINKFDANNTTYANQFNRFLGISLVAGNKEERTASDFALGAESGLQINLTSNAEWWAWGGKFMLPYQTGVAGDVKSGQTPENSADKPLSGTDKFGNAFARAFCDGTRIQVKLWKSGEDFFVAFTPVFTEGEVPDGSENMSYPSGSAFDYVGPYTMKFNWADISKGDNEVTWCVAVGAGNTIQAGSAKVDLSVENVNIGVLYGVTLNRVSHQMKAGDTFTLTGTLNPNSYIPNSAVWSSSNEAIVTVENGKLTAKKSGTATVTYTVDGMNATCEITVIGGLTVTEKTKTLKAGESFRIAATVDPASVKATFASGDNRIATVDENGNVTAVKEGTVKIYVRVGSLFSEEVTVTVTAENGNGGNNNEGDRSGCGSQIGYGASVLAGAAMIAGAAFLIKKRKRG